MIYWIVGLMAFAGLVILLATLEADYYYDDDRWEDDD